MRRVLTMLAFACLAFAPAPLPKKARADPRGADLPSLQGVWVITHTGIGRANVSGTGQTMTVSGRTLTYRTGGRATATWAIELDATKSPPQLDYHGGGKVLLLIYRLQGDTLTLAWQNDDNSKGRPVDFDGGPGIGVSVMQRNKP